MLEALGAPRAFSLEVPRAAARALFGPRMRNSPSRAELYYECPFLFPAGSGLRLRPRCRAEFNPMNPVRADSSGAGKDCEEIWRRGLRAAQRRAAAQ